MPRLIAALIRHGDYQQLPDTPSAHQPFPLTELGRRQAREAAATLAPEALEQDWRLLPEIDSSQMLRAWETARIIGQHLDDALAAPPRIECFDALAERGLGCAANLSVGQIEQILRDDPRYEPPPVDWKSNSHYRLPLQGAESLMQAGSRVAQHIQQRMQALTTNLRQDSLKLFVGHGASIRHAAHRLGVLAFDDIARLSMYHAHPVYLELLPDGSWRQVAGEWKVRSRHSKFVD